MKSVFKIVLLILISCCYLNTVFEYSDAEKKANFENENHTCIQQANQHHAGTITVKHLDDVIINSHSVFTFPLAINDAFRFIEAHNTAPPPERRYVLYASLLI